MRTKFVFLLEHGQEGYHNMRTFPETKCYDTVTCSSNILNRWKWRTSLEP